MSETLFDLSRYKSASTNSYHSDYAEAIGTDPAWDDTELYPNWKNSTAESTGEAEYNSTQEPVMVEESASEPFHAQVEVVEELSAEEEADRQSLELKVERAFYEAGAGLRELRDRRLYRNTHKTFEAYCKDRFSFGRAHSYRLIDAALVVDNLSLISMPEMSPNRRQILPTKLEQVRPLTSLQPHEQREVWQQAVEKAGGKVPSGKTVKAIVDHRKDSVSAPRSTFFTRNEVFQISCKSRKETVVRGIDEVGLSKYDGCWAIATYMGTFTLEVEVHDGILKQVKPDNLTPIDSPQECRQIVAIHRRIKKLRECDNLDRGAYYILEGLGRQTYLTELEDELLTFLEQKYVIN